MHTEDVTDELGRFLSRNDDNPSLKETELERFWKCVKDLQELYRNCPEDSNEPSRDRPPIGSPQWEQLYVKKVVGDNDVKRGFASLFSDPRSWDFISLLAPLSYMTNGLTLKIDHLRRRLRPVDKSFAFTRRSEQGTKKKRDDEVRPADTAGGVR